MKTMKLYTIFLGLLTAGLFVAGCSELKNDIPAAPEVTVHKEGILNPHSENFHGELVKNNHWDMKQCQGCHAADYSGGITGASCKNCHTGDKGPESCNTCHGEFNGSRIAPPRAVNGDTATSSISVGAHIPHTYENTLSEIRCSTCHNTPQGGIYSEGHMNGVAEVVLKGTAIANIADNASYNGGTCANTYCHGNFAFSKADAAPENQFAYTSDAITGNNVTVSWTDVGTDKAKCGTCHGLPPAGHIQVPTNQCAACHATVVDENLNIINKSLHINGVINVRLNK